MYSRKLAPVVEALLAEFRIVYLTGPRQAGKTTLARAIAERMEMGYISLDNPAALASARSDPRGFVQALGERRVVLDEFQYAPGLIPAVKEASDKLARAEQGKFLLTGSADIFRSAKTQEALPGHMARLELLPLSLSEITQAPAKPRLPAGLRVKGIRLKGLDPGQAGSRKRCCDATAGPRSGPRTAHTAKL